MSAPDTNTIVILTEHLGFPPITLVDDIINCVNEVMYKCTEALEKYLYSKEASLEEKLKMYKDVEQTDGIEVGTAKLETLFESAVDKYFDLFELYTLRNILNIPEELVENGYIRLEHYKEVSSIGQKQLNKETKQLDLRIKSLESEIELQIHLRQKLQQVLEKSVKLKEIYQTFKDNFEFLTDNSSTISKKTLSALKSLLPLHETIFFLKNEARQLYEVVEFLDTKYETTIKGSVIKHDARDAYVDSKTYRLLKLYNIRDDESGQNVANIKLNKHLKTEKDVEQLKIVNSSL